MLVGFKDLTEVQLCCHRVTISVFYSYQCFDIDIVKEDTVKNLTGSLLLLWFSLFLIQVL